MKNITTSPLPFIGRILLAAIFILSGLGKLADPNGTIGYIASAGLPLPMLAYVVALAVEVGGGVLLLLGFQARIAALVLAGFTLLAGFGFHLNFADQNQMVHFLKNLAIAGGLLQVFVYGPGTFSLDSRRLAA